MIRLMYAVVFVAAWAGLAHAEGQGRYGVLGTNGDGSAYTGTATIAQTGRGTWSIAWRVANDTYRGFGVGDGRVLAFAYSGGGTTGVISYVATGDGGYAGTWTTSTGRSASTENLRP